MQVGAFCDVGKERLVRGVDLRIVVGGRVHAHGVSLAHDAPQRLFPPVRAVAHDKERRFDVLLCRVSRIACGDDGARAVVEGEIDALFFGQAKVRSRKHGARAQVGGRDQQRGEKDDERNVFFLHISSLGNFYKNIYFFPRVCYNRLEKAREARTQER